MTNQATLPARQRVASHDRPRYLRSLRHPLTRREAEQVFERQQVAEAFGRLCA
ncbi:MAG: hypothetical protein IPI32_12615 [Austwickia sp.]|jgi:hypothetical protein|nr:hypothetical protein [Austwickia sp.]MBK8435076.1 hypothetical protein [Austwickia sp.]MBK9101369.1 hypothetical protein [Austwickia sp.]